MTRDRALACCGLLLAACAELCSTGLLGLSGWFISACAVAGAATFSSFSYLAPSGGVRAFALARVGGNYSKNLVLHAAALRRAFVARTDLFHRAAEGRSDGTWSGEFLDRGMTDADTTGMALINATTPTVVAAATATTGALAVGLASSPVTAIVLAAGAVVTAWVAHRTARTDEQRTRATLRAESVTATDAWPEMASLGATPQLAARTIASFGQLDIARDTVDRHRRSTDLFSGLTGVATVAATIVCCLGTDPATFVFVALTAVGVVAQTEQLSAAAQARTAAAEAHHRLVTPHSRETVPAIHAWATEKDIGFDEYALPPTVLRRARVVRAHIPRGGTLVITGRSGSGKTTLLRTLAAALRQLDPTGDRPTVTAVTADEHLFTGTLGSNWRLADPTVTDADINRHLAELWLDRSGLTADTPVGPGNRKPSGGELRRVYLGRAMATRPHVLIVDEPTTGLDEPTAQHILDILTKLPDTTVIIATHEPPTSPRSRHMSTLPLD
ncbi:ATP-binding cassette domain-containing protein [Actinophytocola sp.]|uniref:ATP-binding cassette domain-containing protein n=1 Tax=Actinophytocola sp. TaxID=1872138 RepID=UPI002ED08764